MATTTNFGWTTPDDTDLVKDGAAAIRTLGSGIDTSLVDLKGGTTGQVLSKASNTDLDYSWTTPNVGDITEVQAGTGISISDGTGPIPVITNTVATEFDAKGDLIVGTGADTFDRLAVGTNGYTLVSDSSTSTGLAWAAAAGGGKILQVVSGTTTSEVTSSSATYADTGITATITPSATNSKILVFAFVSGMEKSAGNAANRISLKLFRGATELAWVRDIAYTNSATTLGTSSAVLANLDSPNTTSATTYKVQFANPAGAAVVSVQTSTTYSSIILLEVGA